MSRTINQIHVALIERTNYPLAPIVMQQVADATESYAKMLAGISNKEKVHELTDKLLQAFSDDHDPVFYSPEFNMALSAMLKRSSIGFVQRS
jgi:FMN-dependent NADH-azoreductase